MNLKPHEIEFLTEFTKTHYDTIFTNLSESTVKSCAEALGITSEEFTSDPSNFSRLVAQTTITNGLILIQQLRHTIRYHANSNPTPH